MPIEREDGVQYDIISPLGQLLVLQVLLRTKLGGGLLAAPVCSTWIWLTRSTTMRSVDYPLGRSQSREVLDANKQAAFLALVVTLCAVEPIRSAQHELL